MGYGAFYVHLELGVQGSKLSATSILLVGSEPVDTVIQVGIVTQPRLVKTYKHFSISWQGSNGEAARFYSCPFQSEPQQRCPTSCSVGVNPSSRHSCSTQFKN